MRFPKRAMAVLGVLTVGISAYSVVGGGSKTSAAPVAMTGSISSLQDHLRDQPKDAAGWAQLGLAYVDQARMTADPARYTQADQVLARSLAVQPTDNDAAHAGLAALAAARHDFAAALAEADTSLAINPYNEGALAVRVDGLVETGRYPEALAAVHSADQLRPGVPIYTRAAYVYELRGDVARAKQILTDTLASASNASDIAYVASALGDLAWSQGNYIEAQTRYADALRADSTYASAIVGRGRTRAAQGDLAGAIADLSSVTARLPLPAYLAALADVYDAAGNHTEARRSYDVSDAWIAVAKANGVATDLDTSLIAADHGNPAEALRAAQAEWARRHSVHVADALAWALHVNGRDATAIEYALQANGAGYRNASFRYHQGVIEAALGRNADAVRDLKAALALNPAFSLGDAAKARELLSRLGAAR